MTRLELVWKKRTRALAALIFLSWGVTGQEEPVRTLFDLMRYQEVLPITIYVDLDSVKAYRDLSDEIETSMTFIDEKGTSLTWEVDIEIRGKYRRRHCAVPPMKLNFKKSQLRKAGLAEFDDLDVVTPCLADREQAKELIVREFLAYQLYNEVTDYSYRVQMIHMTFRNPDTGKEDEVWGFLVEDTAELSQRIGGEKMDTLVLSATDFHKPSFDKLLVFQSMIGNVDWGLLPVKNIKVFRKEGTLIPVAYDFDFSVLVHAPYARVAINSVLRSEKQLRLLDEPETDESVQSTLAYFQSKRDSLLGVAENLSVLSEAGLERVCRHLTNFLDNPYRLAVPLPEKPSPAENPEE